MLLARATPTAISTATTWELYDLIGALVTLVEQMRSMTAARAPIEQAKGVIMALYGVDEQTAFNFLKRRSQDSNIKLRDVVGATLQETFVPQPGTPGRSRQVNDTRLKSTA